MDLVSRRHLLYIEVKWEEMWRMVRDLDDWYAAPAPVAAGPWINQYRHPHMASQLVRQSN